jgi:hypothetical protein
MKKGFIFIVALTLIAMLFIGCEYLPLTSDQVNLEDTGESPKGTVEVRVTDGPPGYEVQEVEMQVGSVEIHLAEEEQYQNEGQEGQNQEQDGDGNWIPLDILEDINPFILTDLQDGKEQALALGHVDPGKYTQIRMGIDWVEVTYTKDGESQETVRATLPGDKLKFVRTFTVEEEETTIITFDFIVDESVVFTGSKKDDADKIIFKPVIKLQIEPGQPDQEQPDQEEPMAIFDPVSGPIGIPIVVTGTGWAEEEVITSVTIGGEAAPYTISVNTDGDLTGEITIPALSPGVKDIIITGVDSGEQTFTEAFTVTPTAIFAPVSGPVGTTIGVTGTGWTGGETIISVTVGGEVAAYSLGVNVDGELSGEITVPALSPGAKDIIITVTESGEQTFTGAFEVTI